MKLYVFGNEYLEEDSMARKVAEQLKKNYEKLQIVHCRSPDDLLDADEITILDVVKGIKEPIMMDDIRKLKSRKILSMHDYDLAFFLKLMEKIGIRKNIKIIGIPSKGDPKIIAGQLIWLTE